MISIYECAHVCGIQEIANGNEQYIVPTSGSPIRGLIQDHVVAGVLLTKRDTFLCKEDFFELVYLAISHLAPQYMTQSSESPLSQDTNKKISRLRGEVHVNTAAEVPPTIWKPKKLWTGKQV